MEVELSEIKKENEELKAEIKRLHGTLSSLDLQELAIQGSAWHSKKYLKSAPIDHKAMVQNAIAHGIVMGFRKKEEMLGISVDNWCEILKDAAVALVPKKD